MYYKKHKYIIFILIVLMFTCGTNYRNICANSTTIYVHNFNSSQLSSSSIKSFEKEFFISSLTNVNHSVNISESFFDKNLQKASLRITLYFLCLAIFVLHKLKFLINFNVSSKYIPSFIELIINFIHKSDGEKATLPIF